MPIDEKVEGLQLVPIPIPQPLSDLGQLSSDGPLLVSVELLHLDIALIAEKVNYLIDCLVVYCLDVASICFRRHLWKSLQNSVVVNPVLTKRKGDVLLLFVLFLLLLKRGVFNPAGFP